MGIILSNIVPAQNSVSFRATGTPDGTDHSLWEYSIGSGYVLYHSGSASTTTGTVTGLSENTTYQLRVRANESSGSTIYSIYHSFTTLKNTIAPTITASISSIGVNGFTINGSSNYTCKTWQYRIGSGSWTSLSTSSSATSVSKAITGLAENTTYSVQVRATRTYNDVLGTSSAVSATTTKSQTAPTITASVSAISTDRFTIEGSANYPCMTWEYQIDGGTWTSLSSSSSATTVSKFITGLQENTTYQVRVRATRTYNDVRGTSSTVSASTSKSSTPPVVSATVTAIGITEFTVNGTADETCKTWQYRIDSGSWTSLSTSSSATSVSKAITGLTPATKYSVAVRATRTYNDVRGTSSAVSATTIGASTMNSVNIVTADAGTVSVTFNWTVPSGTGFTHTLRIKDGASTVVTVTGLTGSSGTKTITLTSAQRTALLNRMPNKKSFTGTFELETLDGSNRVGSLSSRTATVRTLEANSRPVLTGFQHLEKNAKVTAVNPGGYVQGLSDVEAVCNLATARNGASIAKYGLTIRSKTVESASRTIAFGVPTGCGADIDITAYAEDSRGYRATVTDVHTVWCYVKPDVLVWQARRKDSIGEQAALTVVGTVRTVPNNALKTAQYRLRPSGGSWGSWVTLNGLTVEGGQAAGRRGYKYESDDWESLDAYKSYTVQIRYRDLFDEYSDSIQFVISRGTGVISVRDGKVGINQFNPQAALDVNGNIVMNGAPFIESGSNDNGEYIKFADGTLMMWHRFSVRTDISTAYGSLYRSPETVSWTYPVPFKSGTSPVFDITGGSYYSFSGYVSSGGTTALLFYLVNAISSTDRTYTVHLTGYGRWK